MTLPTDRDHGADTSVRVTVALDVLGGDDGPEVVAAQFEGEHSARKVEVGKRADLPGHGIDGAAGGAHRARV